MNKMTKIYEKLAHYIFENGNFPKLKGDAKAIKVIRETADAAKAFALELQKENVSDTQVKKALENKKKMSKIFESVIGEKWIF